jgi:hypothetical protein
MLNASVKSLEVETGSCVQLLERWVCRKDDVLAGQSSV